MAIDKQKPLKQFQLKRDDLLRSPEIRSLYELSVQKRQAFANALKELNLSIDELHAAMDRPLRESGFLIGEAWSFKPNEEGDGLIIQCWAEQKQKGKRRADIETVSFPFAGRLKTA